MGCAQEAAPAQTAATSRVLQHLPTSPSISGDCEDQIRRLVLLIGRLVAGGWWQRTRRTPKKARPLGGEDIRHFSTLVAVLDESLRSVAAIDQAIAQHGGWPDAFQGMNA